MQLGLGYDEPIANKIIEHSHGVGMNITSLSDDMIIKVLSALSITDLINMQMTCYRVLKLGFKVRDLRDLDMTNKNAMNFIKYYTKVRKICFLPTITNEKIFSFQPQTNLSQMDIFIRKASNLQTYMEILCNKMVNRRITKGGSKCDSRFISRRSSLISKSPEGSLLASGTSKTAEVLFVEGSGKTLRRSVRSELSLEHHINSSAPQSATGCSAAQSLTSATARRTSELASLESFEIPSPKAKYGKDKKRSFESTTKGESKEGKHKRTEVGEEGRKEIPTTELDLEERKETQGDTVGEHKEGKCLSTSKERTVRRVKTIGDHIKPSSDCPETEKVVITKVTSSGNNGKISEVGTSSTVTSDNTSELPKLQTEPEGEPKELKGKIIKKRVIKRVLVKQGSAGKVKESSGIVVPTAPVSDKSSEPLNQQQQTNTQVQAQAHDSSIQQEQTTSTSQPNEKTTTTESTAKQLAQSSQSTEQGRKKVTVVVKKVKTYKRTKKTNEEVMPALVTGDEPSSKPRTAEGKPSTPEAPENDVPKQSSPAPSPAPSRGQQRRGSSTRSSIQTHERRASGKLKAGTVTLKQLSMKFVKHDVSIINCIPELMRKNLVSLSTTGIDKNSIVDVAQLTSLKNLKISPLNESQSLRILPRIESLQSLTITSPTFDMLDIPAFLSSFPGLVRMKIETALINPYLSDIYGVEALTGTHKRFEEWRHELACFEEGGTTDDVTDSETCNSGCEEKSESKKKGGGSGRSPRGPSKPSEQLTAANKALSQSANSPVAALASSSGGASEQNAAPGSSAGPASSGVKTDQLLNDNNEVSNLSTTTTGGNEEKSKGVASNPLDKVPDHPKSQPQTQQKSPMQAGRTSSSGTSPLSIANSAPQPHEIKQFLSTILEQEGFVEMSQHRTRLIHPLGLCLHSPFNQLKSVAIVSDSPVPQNVVNLVAAASPNLQKMAISGTFTNVSSFHRGAFPTGSHRICIPNSSINLDEVNPLFRYLSDNITTIDLPNTPLDATSLIFLSQNFPLLTTLRVSSIPPPKDALSSYRILCAMLPHVSLNVKYLSIHRPCLVSPNKLAELSPKAAGVELRGAYMCGDVILKEKEVYSFVGSKITRYGAERKVRIYINDKCRQLILHSPDAVQLRLLELFVHFPNLEVLVTIRTQVISSVLTQDTLYFNSLLSHLKYLEMRYTVSTTEEITGFFTDIVPRMESLRGVTMSTAMNEDEEIIEADVMDYATTGTNANSNAMIMTSGNSSIKLRLQQQSEQQLKQRQRLAQQPQTLDRRQQPLLLSPPSFPQSISRSQSQSQAQEQQGQAYIDSACVSTDDMDDLDNIMSDKISDETKGSLSASDSFEGLTFVHRDKRIPLKNLRFVQFETQKSRAFHFMKLLCNEFSYPSLVSFRFEVYDTASMGSMRLVCDMPSCEEFAVICSFDSLDLVGGNLNNLRIVYVLAGSTNVLVPKCVHVEVEEI